MKFYASIAGGGLHDFVRYEPDPDQSLDPGTGFTQDFSISSGYRKKLWTADFDEI